MTTDSTQNELPKTKRARTLTKLLRQSEHVSGLVEEAAEELSSLNTDLKQELAELDPQPGVESALAKSEAVEDKVQDASEKLAAVNQGLQNEVQDRHVLEEQLAAATKQGEADRHASLHDPLTGLPNRALFNDRLEHGMAQAKRHGWALAVMFLDLDGFKKINDSYGHDVGDGMLRQIAERLKENTRSDDTVFRHGGDEFLYLLMEVRDERDIVSVAEKLIKAIQAPCEIRLRDLTVSASIGASIGIAIYPKNGTTMEMLVKNADEAMYRAKRDKSGHSLAQ
jgi:diguanylate cyclase (GGDEF)-like protein